MAIRSVALAGMVADTSLYNIDGACVVGGTTAIPVGTAVRVTEADPVDGHKVVINTGISGEEAPYGVVVRSHYETPDGTAKAQEAVNVMTHGRVWMRAASNVTADSVKVGAAVSISASGLVDTGGVGKPNWTYAGGFISNVVTNPQDQNFNQQDTSVDGALVEVQIRQA